MGKENKQVETIEVGDGGRSTAAGHKLHFVP